jgi:lipopolysaccharide export system ATP-binding protein
MLLNVEDLVKSYHHRRVVDGVSFQIKAGEIVGLLGRNGAGKTTTFKMVAGMLWPELGSIYLKGKDITRMPMYRRARYGLGYLPQEASVFQGLSVEDNLMAILETLPGKRQWRSERVHQLLTDFGLTKLATQRASTLSGGEMRRLEISRALVTSPSILMLDEPFSGVDPIAVSELQEIIRRLKAQGISILLTDHNVRDSLSVTDHSYIMDEGKILVSGTPQEVLNSPLARARYLGEKFAL